VSNLQGTEVVASMVVFEDGLPRKSEYRRFSVRGTDGQDDTAWMHEVLTRRFRRHVDEQALIAEAGEPTSGPVGIDPDTGRPRRFAYAPNLVVVDGGPPQVAAAQRALDELGVADVALVGLATGLGARYPRFAADNPSQVAGSYGGVAFMIVAVLFIMVMIGLLGWPSSVYLFSQVRGRPLTDTQQVMFVLCFASAALLSIATWLLGMRTGVRALDAMDRTPA